MERLERGWRKKSEGESDIIMFYLKMYKNFTQGNSKFTAVKYLFMKVFFYAM